jgi:hypothetical protein
MIIIAPIDRHSDATADDHFAVRSRLTSGIEKRREEKSYLRKGDDRQPARAMEVQWEFTSFTMEILFSTTWAVGDARQWHRVSFIHVRCLYYDREERHHEASFRNAYTKAIARPASPPCILLHTHHTALSPPQPKEGSTEEEKAGPRQKRRKPERRENESLKPQPLAEGTEPMTAGLRGGISSVDSVSGAGKYRKFSLARCGSSECRLEKRSGIGIEFL